MSPDEHSRGEEGGQDKANIAHSFGFNHVTDQHASNINKCPEIIQNFATSLKRQLIIN